MFVNQFLNIFQTLSRFTKKVFRYLQWFARKFRNVYPCLERIANTLGCCSMTVKRATAQFQNLCWVSKMRRGYQSNLYFMNEELIYLDLKDKSLFLREKCSEDVPVLCSSSSDSCYSIGTNKKKVPIGKNKDKIIPQFIKIKGLTSEDQQRLANEFSEYQIYQSLNDAKAYVKWGNRIKCFMSVLWSGCKRHY